MKIIDWIIHQPDRRYHVFLELLTDEGFRGWGAAFSERQQVVGALAWLKRFVMNENPLEIERVTEKLHQITFWLGRGGAMTHAISAINMALWDVAGQALGQPVHVLLGGRCRDRVPAYGSILFHQIETLPARIQAMRERRFRAFKLGWYPFGQATTRDDEKLVRAARMAAGDNATLIVDAGGSAPYWPLRYKDALERARMLADYRVHWFEEPLAPDDLEGYARLTDESPVKIAHGEVLTRRQTFMPYFQRRAMDIVQPDIAKVGGLSEARRIAWLAEAHGIEIVPHGWNTLLGVLADIHFVSTLPGPSFVEFNVGNALIEETAQVPLALDSEGQLPVPDGPGWGVAIDRERLAQLEKEGYYCESWTWDETREFEAK